MNRETLSFGKAKGLLDLVQDCNHILAVAKHVVVDEEALKHFANKIKESDLIEETKDSEVNHRQKDLPLLERAAVFLAYNVINFSFFPDTGSQRWFVQVDGELIGQDDEAHAIVAAMFRFHERLKADGGDAKLADSVFLKGLTLCDLEEVVVPAPSAGKLSMLEERLHCLHCLGEAYDRIRKLYCKLHPVESSDKQANVMERSPIELLIELSQQSVLRFIDVLCETCPVFYDHAQYSRASSTTKVTELGSGDTNKELKASFLKRIQLCAAMFHSENIIVFHDISLLTVFADYRIPQLLRHENVLHYSEQLSQLITTEELINSGSCMEIEIRAATIVAADQILRILKNEKQMKAQGCGLDYYLWRTAVEISESSCSAVEPFHRCRSIFY